MTETVLERDFSTVAGIDNCMVPGCKGSPKIRGLCKSHYGYCCRYIVQAGLRTWEQLEKEHRVLPAQTRRASRVKDYFLQSENP